MQVLNSACFNICRMIPKLSKHSPSQSSQKRSFAKQIIPRNSTTLRSPRNNKQTSYVSFPFGDTATWTPQVVPQQQETKGDIVHFRLPVYIAFDDLRLHRCSKREKAERSLDPFFTWITSLIKNKFVFLFYK